MMAGRERLMRAVAAALALAGLVLVAGAALIWGAGGFRDLPTSFASGVLPVAAGMFAALSYIGAGWLLASRIPRNAIGWLLLTMGLVFAFMTPTALLVDAAHRALRPAPPAILAIAWALSSFSGPILIGAGTVAGALFPDGRPAGRRGRWALVLAIGGAALLAVATAVRPAGLVWYPTLPNPFAAPLALRPVVSVFLSAATLVSVAGVLAMVLSLVGRYRHGDPTVRAQLRWILYAGALVALMSIPLMIVRFLLPVGDAVGELMVATSNTAMALLPIAATVAITRHRLFGIDFIIGRTLVYVPMMAILGGMYTASIAVFQRIFVAVTGQTSDAPLVMAIFLVATAFTPIRKGLEGVVDRWTRGAAPGQGSSGAVPVPESPADAEIAARVIAMHRLEERVASGDTIVRGAPTQQRLPIDAEGRVACPAGGAPHFVACVGCRYLGGILTAPPTVLCTRPRSPAAEVGTGSDAT